MKLFRLVIFHNFRNIPFFSPGTLPLPVILGWEEEVAPKGGARFPNPIPAPIHRVTGASPGAPKRLPASDHAGAEDHKRQ